MLLLGTVTVYSQISGKIIGIKDGDTVVILLEENIQKTLDSEKWILPCDKILLGA